MTAHIGGLSKSFLGMKIEKNGKTKSIEVRQSLYIENICEGEDLDFSKVVPTPHPMSFQQDRSKDTSGPSDQQVYYRRKVMQIMYLGVRTRPDVLLDIIVLSSRLENPTQEDVRILKRVMVYLYQTKEFGMVFKDGAWEFLVYIDASFNCYENGRGHSGILMFLDRVSAAILAKSLKQQTVSGSSTQAELISLNEGVLHVMWLEGILSELLPGVQIKPIKVYNDNTSMISLAKQPVVNRQGRSKFMNRALFKVNENIAAGDIVLLYEDTETLVADFLTKAVHGKRFKIFRARILGRDGQEIDLEIKGDDREVAEKIRGLQEGVDLKKIQIYWLEAS